MLTLKILPIHIEMAESTNPLFRKSFRPFVLALPDTENAHARFAQDAKTPRKQQRILMLANPRSTIPTIPPALSLRLRVFA